MLENLVWWDVNDCVGFDNLEDWKGLCDEYHLKLYDFTPPNMKLGKGSTRNIQKTIQNFILNLNGIPARRAGGFYLIQEKHLNTLRELQCLVEAMGSRFSFTTVDLLQDVNRKTFAPVISETLACTAFMLQQDLYSCLVTLPRQDTLERRLETVKTLTDQVSNYQSQGFEGLPHLPSLDFNRHFTFLLEKAKKISTEKAIQFKILRAKQRRDSRAKLKEETISSNENT